MPTTLLLQLSQDHSVCLLAPTPFPTSISSDMLQTVDHDQLLGWSQDISHKGIEHVILSGEPTLLYEDASHMIEGIKNIFGLSDTAIHKLHYAQALGYYYPAYEPEAASQNMIVLYAGDSLLFSVLSGGRVIRGQHQLAGNLGESLIKNPGLEGNTYQVEPLKHFVSIQGLRRVTGSLLPQFQGTSPLLTHTLSSLSVADFQQALQQKDELAQLIVAKMGKVLGTKLADLMSTASPDQIIIHGPLAQLGAPFSEVVHASLEHHVLEIFRKKVSIHLSPSSLSEKIIGGCLAFKKQQIPTV
ncbi:MAG: ROK family protein [Bacteroidota bacterium]